MRVLIAVAAVALASAANPSIVLQIPNDEDNATITWDGEKLVIPDHTDKLEQHQEQINKIDGNVSTIKRTLDSLEAKLDAVNQTVVDLQRWKQQTQEDLQGENSYETRLGLLEDDVEENLNKINANTDKIKNRACRVGKYRNSAGFCLNCPSGRYQPAVGKTSCSACPGGKYQAGSGRTSCYSCSRGTYQNSPAQRSCKNCPSGRYEPSGGQSSCRYTCTWCNSATHWYQARCTRFSNAVCREKWTYQYSNRHCSYYTGTHYGSEGSAKYACERDNRCQGVTYLKNVKHGRRRRTANTNTWRKCYSEYTVSGFANRRRRRRRSADVQERFYDYNARPCEINNGLWHCPTWN